METRHLRADSVRQTLPRSGESWGGRALHLRRSSAHVLALDLPLLQPTNTFRELKKETKDKHLSQGGAVSLIEIAVAYATITALVLAIVGGFGMILGQDWWSRLFTFWWRRIIGGPIILVVLLAIWVLNQIFRAPRRQQGHGQGHGAGHGGGGHH